VSGGVVVLCGEGAAPVEELGLRARDREEAALQMTQVFRPENKRSYEVRVATESFFPKIFVVHV
jgi:hypothetical protein